MAIFESELLSICANTDAWNGQETFGMLYGLQNRDSETVILLATAAGPEINRGVAHCESSGNQASVEAEKIEGRWGLEPCGFWHSHHGLGLRTPSRVDDQCVNRTMADNAASSWVSFVTTTERDGRRRDRCGVRIDAYLYENGHRAHTRLRIINGVSPVRLAIREAGGDSLWGLGACDFPVDRLEYDRADDASTEAIRRTDLNDIAKKIATLSRPVQQMVSIHARRTDVAIIVPLAAGWAYRVLLDRRSPHSVVRVELKGADRAWRPIDTGLADDDLVEIHDQMSKRSREQLRQLSEGQSSSRADQKHPLLNGLWAAIRALAGSRCRCDCAARLATPIRRTKR